MLALAISAIPISLVLYALNQAVSSFGDGSMLSGAHGEIEPSALIAVVLRTELVFVQLISLWIPGGSPPILPVVR